MPIVIVKGSTITTKKGTGSSNNKDSDSDSDSDDKDNDNDDDIENQQHNQHNDNDDDDDDDDDDHDNDHHDNNNDKDDHPTTTTTTKRIKKSTTNKGTTTINKNGYLTSMEDLTDLLTLRVYRVSRPSLFEARAIEAKLIGDGIFIDVEKHDDDDNIIRQQNADYDASCNSIKNKKNNNNYTNITNSNTNNDNNNDNSTSNATVIQRIRFLQNKYGKVDSSNKNALKEKVKESEVRKQYTSKGQSLLGLIEENTLNDFINHAIEYTNRNEDSIAYQILSLDEELKHYQDNKDKKVTKSKSPTRNDATDNRKAYSSKADMYHHHQMDLGQQLDKASQEQLASFLSSISFGASNRQLSTSSVTSTFSRKGGASSSLKIGRSLLQHSASRDPHPPASPLSSKARGRVSATSSPKRQKSVSPKPSSPKRVPESDTVVTNPKNDITISNDGETLLAKITNANDRILAEENRPPADRKPPVFKQKARKVKAQSSKTYGNETGGNLDSDHLTAITAKALEDAKRIQDAYNLRMKATLDEFHSLGEKFQSKQNLATRKVNKANKISAKVVESWDKFNNKEIEVQQKVAELSKEIDFTRPQATKWKYQCLMKGDGFKAKGNHAVFTIIKAEKEAKRKQEEFYYDNLAKATWLLTYIGKLRDYAKRKMNMIPINCFKFLSVLQQIIVSGIELDNDIFYTILEKVLTDKDDYAKVVVNKTIKAVRDFLKISPDSFLKYLHNKNITPCPELVKHVKAVEKKKMRKQKIAEQQKAKLHALRELNKGLTSESSRPSSGQGERGLGKNISFTQQRSESSRSLLRNTSKMSMNSDSEFGGTSDWGEFENESEWGLESRDDDCSVYDDF